MRCPLCPDSVLVASHRHGIEVDHCPTCRGVWLDRGELDHLVDSVAQRLGPAVSEPGAAPAGRKAAPTPTPAPTPAPARSPRDHDDDRWRDERRGDERYERDRKRRKKRKHSVLDLLEEVLDF